MKYFAVSDIHGQYHKFITSLIGAGFDINNTNHKLIICGDMFDRGTENLEVYQYIKGLQDINSNNVVVLRGNHELFFDDLLDGSIASNLNHLIRNGFGKTLTSFTTIEQGQLYNNINRLEKLINANHPKLLNWITNLPFYYETKNYVFTHAGIDYQISDWRKSDWFKQVWNILDVYQHIKLKDYGFDKKLVMGHYYTSRLTKEHHNNIYFHDDNQKIFIDGGAALGSMGQINVLVIEDEEI